MKAEQIPNIISIIRFLMIPPAVWALFHERALLALVLFTVAGISDGIDGLLARRYGWITRLGSILDPLADKFMMAGIYLSLGWLGELPWWLVGTVFGRDVLIISGALAYHFINGRYNMEPHIFSKLNTLLQIVLVVSVLFSLAIMPLPTLYLDSLIYLVLFSTLLSGATYLWIWGRRAAERLGD
jgi:cardiolipin synthase